MRGCNTWNVQQTEMSSRGGGGIERASSCQHRHQRSIPLQSHSLYLLHPRRFFDVAGKPVPFHSRTPQGTARPRLAYLVLPLGNLGVRLEAASPDRSGRLPRPTHASHRCIEAVQRRFPPSMPQNLAHRRLDFPSSSGSHADPSGLFRQPKVRRTSWVVLHPPGERDARGLPWLTIEGENLLQGTSRGEGEGHWVRTFEHPSGC